MNQIAIENNQAEVFSLQAVNTSDFKTLVSQAYRAVKYAEFKVAENFFRQALIKKPGNAEVLAGLGQSLCHQQRKQEGLRYLRLAGDKLFKGIRKKNAPIKALHDLANQLSHWGDIQSSLRYLQTLCFIAPSVSVYQSLALDLSRINKIDEALKAVEKALKLSKNNPNVGILLSLLEVKKEKFESALIRLNQLASENHPPEILSRVYLELGVCLDKMHRYQDAFNAFEKSHSIQCDTEQALSIDKNSAFSRIDEIKQGFNEAWFVDRTKSFQTDDLPTPIFLLGFLRSGTTLAEQVLASHPKVFTSDESDILAETINQLNRIIEPGETELEKMKRASEDDINELRGYFWQRVKEEQGEQVLNKTYVEKNALNSISLGFINILFPEAKIIFCLRDPRDVCLSCYMQSFSLSEQTAPLLSWEGTSQYYEKVMDLWMTLKGQLTVDYFELYYEEVVSDFETTFRQLFAFINVEWNPDVEYFYQQTKHKYIATPSFSDVTKPVYQSSKARWKNYSINFESILVHLERFIDDGSITLDISSR